MGINRVGSYLGARPRPMPMEGTSTVKRWIIRIVGGSGAIVALLALVVGGFFFSFRLSLPKYEGTLEAAEIEAPLRIVRDKHAIPHILAQSITDATFGLGYAHAQDRLWQMEMSRRYVQGRLAEMFGENL